MTTLLDPARIFDALGNARNAFGMDISADARVRIFNAIDAPGEANWRDARSIIVTDDGMGETLWQVVVRLNGSWYAADTVVPSSFTILDALERSAQK